MKVFRVAMPVVLLFVVTTTSAQDSTFKLSVQQAVDYIKAHAK